MSPAIKIVAKQRGEEAIAWNCEFQLKKEHPCEVLLLNARAPQIIWGARGLGCVRRCPTFPPGLGSIIGAGRLSFRVRDGSGRFPAAVAAVTLFNWAPAGGTPWWCFWWWGVMLWFVVRGCERNVVVLHAFSSNGGFCFPCWVCVSFRPVSASSLRLLLVF